jgi:gluconate kinase
MKAGLLESQFLALEEPADAIVVSIDQKPPRIAELLAAGLANRRAGLNP